MKHFLFRLFSNLTLAINHLKPNALLNGSEAERFAEHYLRQQGLFRLLTIFAAKPAKLIDHTRPSNAGLCRGPLSSASRLRRRLVYHPP